MGSYSLCRNFEPGSGFRRSFGPSQPWFWLVTSAVWQPTCSEQLSAVPRTQPFMLFEPQADTVNWISINSPPRTICWGPAHKLLSETEATAPSSRAAQKVLGGLEDWVAGLGGGKGTILGSRQRWPCTPASPFPPSDPRLNSSWFFLNFYQAFYAGPQLCSITQNLPLLNLV